MRKAAATAMTILALIIGAAAFFIGFIAILSAVGAYTLAQEVSDRIDDIWGEMVDDELEELTRDETGDE